MTNQFFLWFTGTFFSSRSYYHRHNWSIICRVLLCLFTKISRHHWGLLLSPKFWMVSWTFFVFLLCLTVYLLLHFGQWKNWNTTCKSLSKRSFLFFIPRKFTFKPDFPDSFPSMFVHGFTYCFIFAWLCSVIGPD